jgi:hypothetical protein
MASKSDFRSGKKSCPSGLALQAAGEKVEELPLFTRRKHFDGRFNLR